MKKWIVFVFVILLAGMAAVYGSATEQPATENRAEESSEGATLSSEKTLIAYFAYSENMGDVSNMDVDAIASASLNRHTDNTEGNLQVMAQVIRDKIGADVFHILMNQPYDPDYSAMLPTAINQMENKDWPALQAKIENLADYDVIYLGTPVWNGMLPPAMHTFFAENDLSGKTIVPFGINLGSGFGRIIDEIKELAPNATVTDGFTINASTANDKVKSDFLTWLTEQGSVKQ